LSRTESGSNSISNLSLMAYAGDGDQLILSRIQQDAITLGELDSAAPRLPR
jgi:hypothetical protein